MLLTQYEIVESNKELTEWQKDYPDNKIISIAPFIVGDKVKIFIVYKKEFPYQDVVFYETPINV